MISTMIQYHRIDVCCENVDVEPVLLVMVAALAVHRVRQIGLPTETDDVLIQSV